MVLGKIRCALLPLAVTLLRISTGVIMTSHGWQKLSDIPRFTEAFTNMGLPYPELAVYLAIGGEFFGGLGLIVGFLTPIAAFGVLSTMTVAILKIHFPHGLMAANNGFEYPMTVFFVALFFIMNGAGPISLDRAFCRKSKPADI